MNFQVKSTLECPAETEALFVLHEDLFPGPGHGVCLEHT